MILSTLLSAFVINGQAKPQRLAFGEPDDRLHGARPGDDESGRPTSGGLTRRPFLLRTNPALSIEDAMNTRRVPSASSPVAFATATMRAPSSTLLLLGLIGDRRAR
jgi:hypothetical protein